ncbi:DUF6567 family protein [Marinoscillum sp.]|uniref:DUF6567 family protein n=1 Tax=Marinoscillum sp. TaxID=2024838 RepID=UPI003BAAA30E
MKQLVIIVGIIISGLAISSCGVSNAFVLNHNLNSTQVQLSQNNYQVIGKTVGEAEVSYVLIFGGASKTRLYENAYAEMVKNANLNSGAKALTNIVTEEHLGGVPPFFYKRTITVSANVIEFTR